MGESVGLLGNFHRNETLARDSSILNDWNDFGQEWQVLSSEPKLFHNLEGPQHPEKCDVPPADELRRHLKKSKISVQEAEAACAHADAYGEKDSCVFDVLVTSNKATANAYN